MTVAAERAWIQTASGGRFYPLDPKVEDVCIEDIAHALHLVCRFTGHVSKFYSVAQHSIIVASQVPEADRLWGLMHDASEAYIADIASPLKRTPEFAGYREIEARIMRVICRRFGMSEQEPASIREADLRVLATEKRDLMPRSETGTWGDLPEPFSHMVIRPWPDAVVKQTFLSHFNFLTTGAA